MEELSSEMKYLKCLQVQTKWLAFSYLFFALSDVVMMIVGNKILEHNTDFNCNNRKELRVQTNIGALFLIVYATLLLGFSF